MRLLHVAHAGFVEKQNEWTLAWVNPTVLTAGGKIVTVPLFLLLLLWLGYNVRDPVRSLKAEHTRII